MAKQTVNQLDLIKQLLHDDYLEKGEDAKVLREKGVMERNIIGQTKTSNTCTVSDVLILYPLSIFTKN